MNYSVVLCFFNEIKRVQKSLEKILPYFQEKNEISQIFIVDNNSTDGTKEYLKDLVIEDNKITKIFNEKNLGKGGSIKKAILKAKTDYLIIFDPDLEYDEKELDYLIEEINNKKIDFLLGNRIHQNKNFIYKKNYFGVIILTKIINFLFGTKITDSATATKIFNVDFAKKLNIRTNGFNFEFELLCKFAKYNKIISEKNVSYFPRSFAEGKKINALKDGLKILAIIIYCRVFD
tara:strand:- start:791 stop:1489 length:699 start_codon:yes stop_codon:yes gene_type:complete